jgi:RHS repeat-associated protein
MGFGGQCIADPSQHRSACDANLALIEAYTYDATGNRLSQQIGNNPVTTYSYPPQSHRLIQVGTAVRSFDAAGNTLTGVPGYEADSATNDARNRLTQVGSGSSAQLFSNYNGRGERVLVSQGAPAPELPTTSAAWRSSAGVRGYVYDESGQVISMLIAGSPLRYEEIIWLDHTPIGRVESSTSAVTAVHVIHSDHLNTPRALANAQTQGGQAAGTVVWRWKLNQQTATGSNAFGAQPAEEDPDGNGTRLGFDLRFPGQQYDAATGLHYNYFRDYEPGTGRYVESDPVGLSGGPSLYSYTQGRPTLSTDPSGLATYIVINNNLALSGYHTGLWIIRPGEMPFMYDPAGSYCGEKCGSGHFGTFADASAFSDYVAFQQSDGPDVQIYGFNTSPEDEDTIMNNAMEAGGADPPWCTAMVSQAIAGVGPFADTPVHYWP